MDSNELKFLINELRSMGKRTQTCEVKKSIGKLPKSVIETLCAFANGVGGTLILGLSEKNHYAPVVGFKALEMKEALVRVCNKLSPAIQPAIEIHPYEGAEILVVQVPELSIAERPCFIREQGVYRGSFLRTDKGNRLMTPYEVDRVRENNHQPQWDAQTVFDATIEDLDPDSINRLVQRQRSLHPHIFRHLKDNEVLLNLRVIADDERILRPTLVGLLALGTYPQKYYPALVVKVNRYDDSYKDAKESVRISDSKTFVGSIPEILSNSLDYVCGQGEDSKALPPNTSYYPTEVICEILTNALQHRDYSPEGRASCINMNIFEDRIEILSPGGLYGRMTMDNLRQLGCSANRNQFLSSILEATFTKSGRFVVENRGSGFLRIEEALEGAELLPIEIQNTLTTFKVILPKRQSASIKNSGLSLKNLREGIIKVIQENGTASIRELTDISGCSRPTAYRRIQELLNDGIIEGTDSLRSPRQRYRIKR